MRIVLTDLLLALFAPAINVSEIRITAEGFHLPQGAILIGPHDSVTSLTRAIELFDKYELQNDLKGIAAVALTTRFESWNIKWLQQNVNDLLVRSTTARKINP